MAVQRTGDWARVGQLLAGAPRRLEAAIDAALRQEAQAFRGEIVKGLTEQAPGGEPLRPLTPLTVAARQLANNTATKALIERGDLRRSIAVIKDDDTVFVGISRSARARDGRALIDVAEIHEFGGPPVIIPITPRMRRFLGALFRAASKPRKRGGSGGVIVAQVPPRPFLRPAFNRFRGIASRRFLQRVSREMGLT